MKKFVSYSPEDTKKIARSFAEKLKGNEFIAIDGDLGTGKTVFAKGMAEGLGVTDEVLSPTYTIVHEYLGRCAFYHFDVYRIGDDDEMVDIGYYDYIGKGVVLIEWAQLISGLVPSDAVHVSIERTGENERTITIKDGEQL